SRRHAKDCEAKSARDAQRRICHRGTEAQRRSGRLVAVAARPLDQATLTLRVLCGRCTWRDRTLFLVSVEQTPEILLADTILSERVCSTRISGPPGPPPAR